MADWDWADVAAAGIIARFLREEGLGHTVRWVIDGGFNETQRALIEAGVRYGAALPPIPTRIGVRISVNPSGPTIDEFEKRLRAALEPPDETA